MPWTAVVLLGTTILQRDGFLALLHRTIKRLRAGAPARILLLAREPGDDLVRLAAHEGVGILADPRPPRGNAGALRAALDDIEDWPVVIVNGDTDVTVDYAALVNAYREGGGDALVTVAAASNLSGIGYVQIGQGGSVESFERPISLLPVSGWGHAGVTLLSRDAVALLAPHTTAAIESDLLPSLVLAGWDVRVFTLDTPFEDIARG